MRAPSPQAITQLLLAWQAGDRQALDLLVPVVYEELRRLAHRSLKRERAGHLLQTTALVNEAYLNLVDVRKVVWRDRVHFFAIAAKLMREILVHYARGRDAQKRGGGLRQISLDESALSAPAPDAQLLLAWQSGDRQALDALLPVVYEELRRLARRSMKRERAGHLLQTTALVNEAYLNLVDVRKVLWRDRAHFFAICARLMREILVHYARGRDAQKRGGGFRQVSLDESLLHAPAPDADLFDLDEALTALDSFDARKARVVELRVFGGLTFDETAEVLKVSADTVARDWDFAKTWLYREMTRSPKARSTVERR